MRSVLYLYITLLLSFAFYPTANAANSAAPSYETQTQDSADYSKWSVGMIYRGSLGFVVERQNKGASSLMLEYMPASMNNPWAKVDAAFSPLVPTSNLSFYFKLNDVYDLNGLYFKLGVVDTDGANSLDGFYGDMAVGFEWGKGRLRYVLDYDLSVSGSFTINYQL